MLSANMELGDLERSVADFCESILNPLLHEEASTVLPQKAWQSCAEFGFLGAILSAQDGGRDLGVPKAVAAMVSLGEHCVSNGFSFAVNVTLFSHVATLLHAANDDQKRRYLSALVSGERKAAYALSELESGSDAFALQTTASISDSGYILNGRKSYVSLGPVADFAIVFAQTDPGKGRWGISTFLVDLEAEGIRVERISKAGLHDTPIGEISFKDCLVPESNLLHGIGVGAAIFEESQLWERSFIWASHVGVMRRQLKSVLEHSRSRKQSGVSISTFQSVSNRLADMRLRLTNAELMLRNTAQLKEEGHSIRLESAMTKLLLSENFLENSLDAVRIMGAKGYTNDAAAMCDLNDSVAGLLLGGTNDVQKNLISKLMGA